jgi:hypothetical protein
MMANQMMIHRYVLTIVNLMMQSQSTVMYALTRLMQPLRLNMELEILLPYSAMVVMEYLANLMEESMVRIDFDCETMQIMQPIQLPD